MKRVRRDPRRRIGINTLACMPGRSGGDARYVRELVRHLIAQNPLNDYFLFISPWNRSWFEYDQPGIYCVMCNVPKSFVLRALWEQAVLPILARRLQLDLFHAPVNVAPLAISCPIILTLLEAEPFMFPKLLPPPLLLYWRVMRRASAMRAERIIAISHSSKRELCHYMRIDPSRVEVTPLGVDMSAFEGNQQAVASGLPPGVQAPYLLWTGRAYPRKNLIRLIEAFGKLKRESLPHQLILVGTNGWGTGDLAQAISGLGIYRNSVTTLGYVPDQLLSILYREADAFVFPSLHEAFGLPVLEALAYGTPVVTSATTATAEIAGDVAVLIDPLDVCAIAHGIQLAILSRQLGSDAAAKRSAHAATFTWHETAANTLNVYDRAVNTFRRAPRRAPTRLRAASGHGEQSSCNTDGVSDAKV